MPLTLRAVLLAALISGLAAGLVFFAVQSVTTRPLIVQAEILERASAELPLVPTAGREHGHPEHRHAHTAPAAWEPAEGGERTAYTLAACILIGIGYAFLLVGAISVSGRTVAPLSGVAWGAAGFLAFFAAPSLGLPPEPPGAQAADLLLRQVWWLGTALGTCAGLWLLVLGRGVSARLAGAGLLLLPHLIGAPYLPGAAGDDRELAANFAVAAMAANAALWLSLGLGAGTLLPRLAERPVLARPGHASTG